MDALISIQQSRLVKQSARQDFFDVLTCWRRGVGGKPISASVGSRPGLIRHGVWWQCMNSIAVGDMGGCAPDINLLADFRTCPAVIVEGLYGRRDAALLGWSKRQLWFFKRDDHYFTLVHNGQSASVEVFMRLGTPVNSLVVAEFMRDMVLVNAKARKMFDHLPISVIREFGASTLNKHVITKNQMIIVAKNLPADQNKEAEKVDLPRPPLVERMRSYYRTLG